MAYTNFRLASTPLSAVVDLADAGIKRPLIFATKRISLPPIQVIKEEREPNLIAVSRRNTMVSMVAGVLGGFAIFSAEAAEARVGRLEGKIKVMEKLRKKAKSKLMESENKGLSESSGSSGTNPVDV